MLSLLTGLGRSALDAQLAYEMFTRSFLNNWTVLMQHVSTMSWNLKQWETKLTNHDVNSSKVKCDMSSRFGYGSQQGLFQDVFLHLDYLWLYLISSSCIDSEPL
jgi:hypothetical protein